MKENIFCNNCGKSGHLFHHCKYPITSLGIIVFNNDDINNIKYLMIRRKDSLGFVDFIRGKYPIYNKRYIQNLLDEMTYKEIQNILELPFEKLWIELWGDINNNSYKVEEKISKDKFNQLKKGIYLDNNYYNLHTLIKEVKNKWLEPEWGFPKGRRNYQERDLECALREFEEETGYSKNDLKLISNISSFEETFTGSNYKSYKHKYFLGYMKKEIKPINNFQKSEVSKIEWLSLEESIQKIRPHCFEKIKILQNIHSIFLNKNIYLL